MRILIIDDCEYFLQNVPQGESDHVIETMQVIFDRNEKLKVNIQKGHDTVDKILNFKPDIIFLDHYLDGDFSDEYLPDGEWIASWLREKGYQGKIIGTSSQLQRYCSGQSGKTRDNTLEELLSYL